MIGLDTNVVVRLIVDDDPEQTARAKTLFTADEVWIGPTVLLETAWVLRAAYGLTNAAVVRSLRGVLGLPNVSTADAPAVERALSAAAAGVDIADALHVALLPAGVNTFATFDRELARRGPSLGTIRLA